MRVFGCVWLVVRVWFGVEVCYVVCVIVGVVCLCVFVVCGWMWVFGCVCVVCRLCVVV